jgi:hypothetical protein
MRLTYEPLFKQYGVDVAFNGHDHSYDRSFPTFNNAVDLACGTTHLTLGNAGADDLTLGYIDQVLGTESELGYYNIQYCNKGEKERDRGEARERSNSTKNRNKLIKNATLFSRKK